MIAALRQLIEVREAQHRALEFELAERRATLAAIDAELEAVERELEQIARQQALWEGEWQQWQRHDRVLRHGQDYNLAHVALSAWQRDAQQLREEILARREHAAEKMLAARQLVIKAQRRLSMLAGRVQELQRQARLQRAGRVELRMHDEHAARAHARRASTG